MASRSKVVTVHLETKALKALGRANQSLAELASATAAIQCCDAGAAPRRAPKAR